VTKSLPSRETVAEMLSACDARFIQLMADGCEEQVALDRTWDAYCCALMRTESHCFDPRDRLFESKLRTIREKG